MRIANRLIALLVAAALLAVGLLVVVEVVAQLLGADPVIFDWTATYRWISSTTWDSTVVRAIAAALIVVGLALLIAQLVPRRPTRLGVHSGEAATDAAITRHSLAQTLTDAVSHLDGIGAVRVGVRRRRVRIKAKRHPGLAVSTAGVSAKGVSAEDVARVAQHRLDELNLRRPPRVAVNMSRGG